MPDVQDSLISQLLCTLGITREDLEKRSDQMRQFLTAENASSLRVADSLTPFTETGSSSMTSSIPNSLTRQRSRAESNVLGDVTPPTTPAKGEPFESCPPRHFDSMEVVIERQRRQNRRGKKERREKERESQAKARISNALSTSPNIATQTTHVSIPSKTRVSTRITQEGDPEAGGNELLKSRSDIAATPPITPQRNKYYRDHTNHCTSVPPPPRKEQISSRSHSSASVPQVVQTPSQSQLQYFSYPHYADASLLPAPAFPNPPSIQSTASMTPQNRRIFSPQKNFESSPLPSSSPPASSPVATPQRPIVNLVSSPGPMGPLPDEEEYDNLPYTLPPGPYSSAKPDLSYAALVGQAILSSPDHRLTLQEIYDWITIVYPHFKRGETTWMNSIRHVLSTTVCFRKVTRDRSLGRTLWAIWDEDLECFKDGGFKKHFCKDIVNSTVSRDQSSKNKGKGRKRMDLDSSTDTQRAKRLKKDHSVKVATTSYTPATMTSSLLFPPTRPSLHHQPYYDSCIQPRLLPTDIIFPPLPAGVAYGRKLSNHSPPSPETLYTGSSLEQKADEGVKNNIETVSSPPSLQDKPTSMSAAISSSSVPELVPNRSSSSSPLASSEIGPVITSVDLCLDDYITIGGGEEATQDAEDFFIDSSLLNFVKTEDSPQGNAKLVVRENISGLVSKLESGRSLSVFKGADQLPMKAVKTNKNIDMRKMKGSQPTPTSPTLNRKTHLLQAPKPLSNGASADMERPTTPAPTTPPRNTSHLPVSSVRTPLSSKGINPAALQSEDDDIHCAKDPDLNRTPRKRVTSSGNAAPAPITPRRLVFSANQNDSPICTPLGGGGIFSPFRTPSSRSVFDPHDPATLLDEELNRMGASAGDSPIGVFGKGRGSLLYDSPGFTSPGQYTRWW